MIDKHKAKMKKELAMSFSGSLEHLPIVDVLQLLETTKKSGTLIVKNDNCIYKFGFEDGYIVSVTHPDTSLSLGKVLAINKIIDEDTFSKIYDSCTVNKKSILNYLVEHGIVSIKSLHAVLANLIELTVVDILLWSTGNFELLVNSIDIPNEYKYLSDSLSQKIRFSTQNTLMEALRIYDEWRRDNRLPDRLFIHNVSLSDTESDITITEDILGLSNIDKLERKIPNVFTGIKEHDYFSTHLNKIKTCFPDFSNDEQIQLAGFLADLDRSKVITKKYNFALILLTDDNFTIHATTTICKNLGAFMFSTDSEENLSVIINQSIAKELLPIIIIDKNFAIQKSYPAAKIIRLVTIGDYPAYFEYFQKQIFDFILKPDKTDATNIISFYKAFYNYLENLNKDPEMFLNNIYFITKKTKKILKISDSAIIATEFLEQYFQRIITFQLQKDTTMVEKNKGFIADFDTANLLKSPTILNCITTGNIYYDVYNEELEKIFYVSNPKPSNKRVCVLPLRGINKTIYLFYADEPYSEIKIQYLELFQNITNFAIDALLYRKLFEKTKKTE